METREQKWREKHPLSDPGIWRYHCCSLCGYEYDQYLGMSSGVFAGHGCSGYFAYISFSYPSNIPTIYIPNWKGIKWRLFGIRKNP